jgi:hypothetical protein
VLHCQNCGHEIGGVAKFCPECGQDQRVSAQQDERIATESVHVPPPPDEGRQIGIRSRFQGLLDRFNSLSREAKVIVVIAIFTLVLFLSPVLATLAILVLSVSLLALPILFWHRKPLNRWGIAAASSLVLAFVFTGVSNAIYSPSNEPADERAAAPEVTV